MTGIVQYIIVRSDLITDLKWTLGSVITQACHASTAAIHQFRDDEYTKAYLADLDNMHKITLQVVDMTELKELHKELEENKIDHRMWLENPGDIPTALALKPYPKTMVKGFVRKLKLFGI